MLFSQDFVPPLHPLSPLPFFSFLSKSQPQNMNDASGETRINILGSLK